MALDKTLKIYDDQGNEVDYDILAKDVKFLPDGKDLPTKLAELEDEIGEGGYTPPVGGIPKTDLAPDVQTSLGKADTALQSFTETDPTVPSWAKQPTKPTYTAQEVGALPADTPIPTKTSDLNNDSGFITEDDIPEGTVVEPATAAPSMDGTAAVGSSAKYAREDHVHPHDTSKQDTITDLATIRSGASAGATALQPADVSVETPATPDGTVDINVGSDTYTINLNHTHEGMAKLIVCEESELPSTLEEDTIYGVEEDGEISVLYVGGIPFYGGGGGGTSTPVLRQPADGSTIDVGKIASGESSATKTITVKGKNLTQALTIAVTGTGYSVNKQTISAADANVGTTLTITCTNTADDAAGTLSIASSEVSCDCDLVANAVTYETLRGVKFTGSQWVETDYYPNTNTEFEMDLKLTANANTPATPSDCGIAIMRSFYETSSNERFTVHVGRSSSSNQYGAYTLFFMNKSGSTNQKSIDFSSLRSEFVADHAKLSYIKGTSAGTFKFNGGTERSVTTALADVNMSTKLDIGYNPAVSQIFAAFDLTIYEFTITESGNVVRHWVPKMKNGTIPGLYDTVTGKFISSETSTELVAVN